MVGRVWECVCLFHTFHLCIYLQVDGRRRKRGKSGFRAATQPRNKTKIIHDDDDGCLNFELRAKKEEGRGANWWSVNLPRRPWRSSSTGLKVLPIMCAEIQKQRVHIC